MENLYSSKAAKMKSQSLNRSVMDINVQNIIRRYRNSVFDPYASDSSDSPSPVAKYFRSTTPLSAIENLQSPPTRVFNTPVKVEEDVLVMDGILIDTSSKNSDNCGFRLRSSSKSSDSGRRSGGSSNSPLFASSSSSGGDGGEGSENNNRSLYSYKAEKCRPWEKSGTCIFGSDCQFAHGKEELMPWKISSSSKNKFEMDFNLVKTGKPRPKGPDVYHPNVTAIREQLAPRKEELIPRKIYTSSKNTVEAHICEPYKTPGGSSVDQTNDVAAAFTPSTGTLAPDWTPQDDGIEVTLPCGSTEIKKPSREEVDYYIQSVLYGKGSKKRFSVFTALCTEED